MEYQWEEAIALPVTDIPSGNHIMQLQQKGKITFQTKLIRAWQFLWAQE